MSVLELIILNSNCREEEKKSNTSCMEQNNEA